MRIDSHQHFWKFNDSEFGWINDQMSILKRDFLPSDLKLELEKIGFDGSVVVQARQSLNETDWILKLAEENKFIKGVVAWLDLCSDAIGEQLEKYAKHPKLVGVRHVIHDEADDNFMLRPDFIRGVKQLKDFDLAYDILIFPKHLGATLKFVEQMPDQRFVLDHIAKPLIKDGIVSPWREDIQRLAAYPNVYCKLSGMVTEADWKNHKPENFKAYLDVVTEAFGLKRLMIGSDWPVCTLAGDYSSVMNIVNDYISKFSAAKQYAVLGGNAVEVYRLGK